jgi:monoamine oxidase
MARSDLFSKLKRTFRIARYAEAKGLSSREAVDRADGVDTQRRRLLLAGGATIAASAIGCAVDASPSSSESTGTTRAALPRASGSVGIIGAGLAGLACARELKRSGLNATIYEASQRAGGRCYSLSGLFPGQTAERGGELIDTAHKTMLGWANEFGLSLHDVGKDPGDVFYHVNGQAYPESVVVDEYRALVDAMRDDLRSVGEPTAASFTPADETLDRMTLRQYLASRGAGSVIRTIVDVAYTIEYGLDADRLSALSFLLFIHADRRSKFAPWGVFSDERFHVVGGNDQIATGLANSLPGQIQYGRRLVKVARRTDGRVELTLDESGRTRVVTHDAVVIAIPFSVLRGVQLDSSLNLSAAKKRAIAELQYGTNSKLLVGFGSRPWDAQGSNGAAYSNYPYLQTTWETDAGRATATRAVITDYTGGALGASLDPNKVQTHVKQFLADFEKIYPGASAAAARTAAGAYVAHLEAWPRNPLSQGSYTANHPGYFTTIADEEAKPSGNVIFAGEHTSSFYEWQGFMEGAALSGLRAAGEIAGILR